MNIRIIRPDELATFAAVHTRPEDVETIHSYLYRLLDQESTHYDWCFVIEEGTELLGRVAFWSQPKRAAPSDIVLLDLAWAEAFLPIGTAFLPATAQMMRQRGTTDLGYALDVPPRPPQWQHTPEQRHTLLMGVGFQVIRATRRWTWPTDRAVPSTRQRLVFRSLPDVGEAVFLDALEQVMRSSLDQRTTADRAAYGAAAAAQQVFAICAAIGYDPQWWQLAYTPPGTLIGMLMPAGTATWATIGYIGVIPAHRGHGYIDDLLVQTTQILTALRAARIEADTDVRNMPMANALQRLGWLEFGMRREYLWQDPS